MVTMTTTLIILGRNNLNEMEIYLTLWMWWRMWQTYTTTMLQMMMKVTMTTWMMKTPLPKPKIIPILPTQKWEDGGYGQRLSYRCKSVFLVILLCFPKPWQLGVLFWCVCAFFRQFLTIGVCVE